MGNLHFVIDPRYPLDVSYGRNLVRATRDFLLAVFGVRVASRTAAATLKDDRANKIGKVSSWELRGLAARFDSTSPNLASELRMMAGSD